MSRAGIEAEADYRRKKALKAKAKDRREARHLYMARAYLSHPLRARLMQAFCRGAYSPAELYEWAGSSLGVVSYHVRELEAVGLVVLAGTVPRRGALQHYYTAHPEHVQALIDYLFGVQEQLRSDAQRPPDLPAPSAPSFDG